MVAPSTDQGAGTPDSMEGDDAPKDADQAKSRLMGLPAELRNWIYELVVLKPTPIDIVSRVTKTPQPSWLNTEIQQPALSRVCRQLRREALSLFYAGNTFKVTAIHGSSEGGTGCIAELATRSWLRGLSEANKNWLFRITICTTIASSSKSRLAHRSPLYYSVEKHFQDDMRRSMRGRRMIMKAHYLAGWI